MSPIYNKEYTWNKKHGNHNRHIFCLLKKSIAILTKEKRGPRDANYCHPIILVLHYQNLEKIITTPLLSFINKHNLFSY
jgi:hypothetical protein